MPSAVSAVPFKCASEVTCQHTTIILEERNKCKAVQLFSLFHCYSADIQHVTDNRKYNFGF